jgi:hypothetical protein
MHGKGKMRAGQRQPCEQLLARSKQATLARLTPTSPAVKRRTFGLRKFAFPLPPKTAMSRGRTSARDPKSPQ